MLMKLIDKDDVVAEIEKIYNEDYKFLPSDIADGIQDFKDDVLININTLEVKEVDLELNSFNATVCKNGNTYLKEMDKDAIIKALEPYKEGDKVKVIIKSQKGE